MEAILLDDSDNGQPSEQEEADNNQQGRQMFQGVWSWHLVQIYHEAQNVARFVYRSNVTNNSNRLEYLKMWFTHHGKKRADIGVS